MDFVSIRIITSDVTRLVTFYEGATGLRADWATDDFAELRVALIPPGHDDAAGGELHPEALGRLRRPLADDPRAAARTA